MKKVSFISSTYTCCPATKEETHEVFLIGGITEDYKLDITHLSVMVAEYTQDFKKNTDDILTLKNSQLIRKNIENPKFLIKIKKEITDLNADLELIEKECLMECRDIVKDSQNLLKMGLTIKDLNILHSATVKNVVRGNRSKYIRFND